MNTNTDTINSMTKTSPLVDLFNYRDKFENEIQKRSQDVLRAMGYDWYKMHKITAALSTRGKVQIISIRAEVESNFASSTIEAEMPVKQFEMLLQPGFASE